MLRVRISRRRLRRGLGVTSFKVFVGGYISVEFDVLISSSCFVFLLAHCSIFRYEFFALWAIHLPV